MINKTAKFFIVLVLSISLITFCIPKLTKAVGIISNDVCQNAKDSPACKASSDNPISGQNGIIIKVTRIIAYISGIAAVIVIMLGGYKIILSGGNSENITKGREMITYAAIGLIVVIIAQAIVTFVVNRI